MSSVCMGLEIKLLIEHAGGMSLHYKKEKERHN